VVRVRSERTAKKTGACSFETRAYICSDLPGQQSPAQWLALIHGHWAGVEIRNPNALANLAALRSVCLHLIATSHPDTSWPVVREQLASKPAECLSLVTS